MKAICKPPDYMPPRLLREEPVAPPAEMDVQALWFEQLFQPGLVTDDGRMVEVIQPGFWNHAGGPDFDRAVLRFSKDGQPERKIVVGNVEVHLRPADWHAHGHDTDAAYENTVLHAVWETPGAKSFFSATASFRHVPQVVLGKHLIAPWPELRPLCASLLRGPLPNAVPGRCSAALAALPGNEVAEILRAAGMYRLRQKARRWFWRRKIAGPEQALFEALAEALGFHANQIPMRLVAQRLPWKKLRGLDATARLAHLFGLSGFLPGESVARLTAESRGWLRELWEIWWKVRASFDYAQMSRTHWRLAGLRPLNRPERRLAALAQLVPRLGKLLAAIGERDADRFADLLLAVRDPFWETHATLTGAPMALPARLIGEERAHDMLTNIFWPMVLLDDEAAAQRGLKKLSASGSNAARIASQRMLVSSLTPKQQRETLIQQGLLQVFRDYCQTDCSQCRDCTFPELVAKWADAKR